MAALGRGRGLGEDDKAAVDGQVLSFLGRHRTLVQGLIDGFSWSVALFLATLFRTVR